MTDIETVQVKTASGAKSPFVVINKADFDPNLTKARNQVLEQYYGAIQ